MMLLKKIFSSCNLMHPLAGLPSCTLGGLRNISSGSGPLFVHVTNMLLGEPLKKKRKIDANVMRKREERRKRKLQKQIRRMERFSTANLKPIEEMEIPLKLMDQIQIRTRAKVELDERESEMRVLLEKSWCNYRHKMTQHDTEFVKGMLMSQEKALKELKAVSNDLYSRALMVDKEILPYRAKGPCDTPPKHNYYCPDGKCLDKTVIYPGEQNES